MSDKLNRLIELAKRTGDRLIIYDSYTDESMVLMGLDEYEDMVENMVDGDFFDVDEQDEVEDDWYSAAEVLEKYSESDLDEPIEKIAFHSESNTTEAQDFPGVEQAGLNVQEQVKKIESEMIEKDRVEPKKDGEEEPIMEDLPFEEPMEMDDLMNMDQNWEEEPLPSDEPIFLEEPIS